MNIPKTHSHRVSGVVQQFGSVLDGIAAIAILGRLRSDDRLRSRDQQQVGDSQSLQARSGVDGHRVRL